MKRILLRIVLATVLVVPPLLVATLYLLLTNDTFVRGYVLPMVSTRIGHDIAVEGIQLDPLRGISVQGLRYNCPASGTTCPPEAPLAITAKSLSLSYDPWRLLSRQIKITSIRGDAVMVYLSERAAQKGENGVPQERSAPRGGEEATSFSVVVDDAVLEKSYLNYRTVDVNQDYQLDDIQLRIRQADSHGTSNLNLSALLTAKAGPLQLEKEKVSTAVTLRDSRLFLPGSIDVDLQLGSVAPLPFELKGALKFRQNPYALDTVVLERGALRESLRRFVRAPTEMLEAFDYEVSGGYRFSTPAKGDVKLAVKSQVFRGEGRNELAGSQLKGDFEIGSDGMKVSNGGVEVVNNGAPLLTMAIDGEFPFDRTKNRSVLSAKATHADFDLLEALYTSIAPKVPASAGQGAEPSQGGKVPAAAEGGKSEVPPLALPLIDATVSIEKSVYQRVPLSDLAARAEIADPHTIKNLAVRGVVGEGGTFSVDGNGSLNGVLRVKARGDKIDIVPFAALVQGDGALLEGNLQSLDVDLSASVADIRRTLTGHVRSKIIRMIVPSTLQEQIPFNILFLPLDALITVFGGTINAVLPSSVSSVADAIRETLDEAGRLGIRDGTINLDFDNGKISCKEVDINTKNLPDFTFKGSVSRDDDLDFTIFIGLLKLNIPLPVAGTLAVPLPDLVYLGPEIVRGLGLSVGNIVGDIAAIGGGGASAEGAREGAIPPSPSPMPSK